MHDSEFQQGKKLEGLPFEGPKCFEGAELGAIYKAVAALLPDRLSGLRSLSMTGLVLYIDTIVSRMNEGAPEKKYLRPADRTWLVQALRWRIESDLEASIERPDDAHAQMLHDIWLDILMHSLCRKDGADSDVDNPAIMMTNLAKSGHFDSLSEAEYHRVLSDAMIFAHGIDCKTKGSAWDMLKFVSGYVRIRPNDMDAIAWLLSRSSLDAALYAKDYPDVVMRERRNTAARNAEIMDVPDYDPAADCPMEFERSSAAEDFADEVAECEPAKPELTPAGIYEALKKGVYGQDRAVRDAAMLIWHHLRLFRQNAIFAGPSGCGKSEIWRQAAKLYPDRVRMIDASRMTADGWLGSVHLQDVFMGLDPETIRRQGLIVVLDEADKVICETIIGASGTDHSALLQSNLLKMMDGDVLEFRPVVKNMPDMIIDCSKISVVMLGTFEKLLRNKGLANRSLGFGAEVRRPDEYYQETVGFDDLIKAGMRREIAGRVNKISMLRQLEDSDYEHIMSDLMLPALETGTGRSISLKPDYRKDLIRRGKSAGMGVRWIRSEIMSRVDDLIFDNPDQESFCLACE